ncbi:class I SAM-dependent methyltransferase [Candidatus Amesbacteria bacterium]|nr:class I SAM-dependent methyltransferase [Candidatus Amesbacteria bacterium]
MMDYVCRQLLKVEESDWWRRGVRDRANWFLERYGAGGKILDVGCGGGYFLAKLPNSWQKWGIDISPVMVEKARERDLKKIRLGKMENLPYADNFFDTVTALDVLEHVRREDVGLREMRRVLKPRGVLILNVPAYQWLWSYHDVTQDHVRRYTREQLAEKLRREGFEMIRATYSFMWLVPLALVFRAVERRLGMKRRTDVGVANGWMGKILYWASLVELQLMKIVVLSAGTSVMLAARKIKYD